MIGSKLTKSIETDKLKRVDTSIYETATAGVEYISPDQHGGYFGIIYRQYHGVKEHGNSITITGITKLIDFGGRWNTINVYGGLMYDGTATIRILKGTNKIDFIIIGTAPIQEGWVDYVI